MNNDLVLLINDIYKIDNENILDKIIEYCDVNDLDIQEVGDILSESEDFKNILYKDCVKSNVIRDEVLSNKMKRTQKIFKW